VKAHEIEAFKNALRDGILQLVDGKLVEAPQFISFRNHVQRLKKSPLFNLSLASKELFHSNFLAWLCEAYPNRNRSPEFQAISKAEGNRLDSLLVWKS
jgi:hypothetical protein